MDWLSAGFSLAQKHAQDAAEKAKLLAQQAAEQARVLAEQAKEAATTIAYAAAEEAKGQLKQGTPAPSKGKVRPEEIAAYAVTAELTDYIKSLTYVTFSDYPKEDLEKVWELAAPVGSDAKKDFRLNPWQERHALVVLQTVPHLEDLRFVLCPRRMDEGQFWKIYFALTKEFLPPQAFTGELPVLQLASAPQTPAGDAAKSKAVQMTAMTSTGASAAGDNAAGRPPAVHTAGADARDTSPSRHTSETVVDNFTWSEMEGDADAELETYLKEALQSADGDGGGPASSEAHSSELGDLDEYLDQLNIEEDSDKTPPASQSKEAGAKPAASTP